MHAIWKIIWQFLLVLKTQVPDDPTIPFPGTHRTEMWTYVHQKSWTRMFIAKLFRLETIKSPSMVKWYSLHHGISIQWNTTWQPEGANYSYAQQNGWIPQTEGWGELQPWVNSQTLCGQKKPGAKGYVLHDIYICIHGKHQEKQS